MLSPFAPFHHGALPGHDLRFHEANRLGANPAPGRERSTFFHLLHRRPPKSDAATNFLQRKEVSGVAVREFNVEACRHWSSCSAEIVAVWRVCCLLKATFVSSEALFFEWCLAALVADGLTQPGVVKRDADGKGLMTELGLLERFIRTVEDGLARAPDGAAFVADAVECMNEIGAACERQPASGPGEAMLEAATESAVTSPAALRVVGLVACN